MQAETVQLLIEASLPVTEDVTDITFGRSVMVSLDCRSCKRCDRSAVIGRFHWGSYCTPDRHKFHGNVMRLKSRRDSETNVAVGSYLIQYEFEHFIDAKYPQRIPWPGSRWARVNYTVRCRCGSNIWREVNNLLVLPERLACECGRELVVLTEDTPSITRIG